VERVKNGIARAREGGAERGSVGRNVVQAVAHMRLGPFSSVAFRSFTYAAPK
jgi:hypothetical protein